MESPVHVQEERSPSREDYGGKCGQFASAAADLQGQFTIRGADTLVALDSGAAANLVSFTL